MLSLCRFSTSITANNKRVAYKIWWSGLRVNGFFTNIDFSLQPFPNKSISSSREVGQLTYKKMLFWLCQMSSLQCFIVLAGDQLILIFPASLGREVTKGDEINVCAERERESKRKGENKRKLPPQHKFTMMLGDKRGGRCN